MRCGPSSTSQPVTSSSRRPATKATKPHVEQTNMALCMDRPSGGARGHSTCAWAAITDVTAVLAVSRSPPVVRRRLPVGTNTAGPNTSETRSSHLLGPGERATRAAAIEVPARVRRYRFHEDGAAHWTGNGRGHRYPPGPFHIDRRESLEPLRLVSPHLGPTNGQRFDERTRLVVDRSSEVVRLLPEPIHPHEQVLGFPRRGRRCLRWPRHGQRVACQKCGTTHPSRSTRGDMKRSGFSAWHAGQIWTRTGR